MSREISLAGPRPLRGSVRVPGDKSISHRALMLASVAEGRCMVRGLGTGEDVRRSRELVEALGVRVAEGEAGRELRIQGTGWDGLGEPRQPIDCENSGTTMRVGLGYLAGRPFHAVLVGDASLAKRPMLRVVEPLRAMGARVDGRSHGEHPPLAIRGGALEGMRHELTVASAQVKTALVLAGLQAAGTTVVAAPRASRDHTERMLASLGVPVEVSGNEVAVRADVIPAFDIDVPGDASSAAFLVTGALITPGSEIAIQGVSLNPTRIRFVEVLRRMGARIEVEEQGESCGEPVGVIRAWASDLSGTRIDGEDVALVIDEVPALAVAAAFAEGVTEIRDAEELAVKESNRIGAIEQELSQLNVAVEARKDGLTIRGGRPMAGRFKSHGDHRIAMAAAVAANACEGESRIQGWRAVAVSYPEFGEHLAALTGG